MTRASPKPLTPSLPPAPPPLDSGHLTGDILTLPEVAAYLRLPEEDVLQLIDEQGLPARRIGKDWRFLKEAVQYWLKTGPPPKSNNEAWMALAGIWKDDPLVEEEMKEIYRRRRRID
jgi:excisionase family DNA binding protein